jgi:ArsR family transcriptional regulator
MLTSVENDVLRLLGDPLRHRIVQLLSQEQLCTCHLVEETGARQTNVSNHLRLLKEAGLVVSEPAGRYTYYRLVPEALEGAADALRALAETARGAGTGRRACP